MGIKKIAIILLVVIIGCFASIELSYGETGEIGQSPSIKSNAIENIVSEDVLIPSYKTEEWLFAQTDQPSKKKKRDFTLFGKPQSLVDYKEQTKEWEARTLRSLALGEFTTGIILTLGGLFALDDSAAGGLFALTMGAGMTYIGYKDLKASKRFFYPDSQWSQKNMYEEEMYRSGHRDQNKKDIAIYINLAFR